MLLVGSVTAWLSAADYAAETRAGSAEPHEAWVLPGPDVEAQRLEALARAAVVLPRRVETRPDSLWRDLHETTIPACQFIPSAPSGTTAKFDCLLADGERIKVKYGRDAEIHAEAAATALLRSLGYPADRVTIVPRLRCYGCPRHPFVVMRLLSTLRVPFVAAWVHDDYSDFTWVSVEQRFPAPAIETEMVEGWEWNELDRLTTSRAEVDAFKLLAVFIAHWDNKSSNQRLVCLDDTRPKAGRCARPLAMIQDLGASFGPTKVNLARWRDLPVWHDRDSCTVSMRAMPFDGATFPDAQISEGGRALLAARLLALTNETIERLFAEARFPQFQVGTDDEGDLKAWTAAFRSRVRQITEARCGTRLALRPHA